ncbi:hypothetical protein JUNP353_2753 [Elizabethkingia anophelis]|nr:hypothetical protein JUNP353_2753 [Elizabethkingia anophelis]
MIIKKKLISRNSFEHFEIQFIAKGLYMLDYYNSISGYNKEALLTKCRVRKPIDCNSTNVNLKGKDAYRPICNGYIRRLRFDANVIESL